MRTRTIWVVYMDDVPDYASYDWNDALDRYFYLVKGYGEERVKMKECYLEED